MSRAASLAKQVTEKNLSVASPLIVNPGSEQIRATAERDGMIEAFERLGATIMANACGPCIGQWKRQTDDPTRKNSIVTSFNRNFAKRADGNPNTYAFVASPELTMALTIAGDLCFNPLKDRLVNHNGEKVKLSEPVGDELPLKGFEQGNEGYIAPHGAKTEIRVKPDSQRLQLLTPFPAWDGQDLLNMPLLIKAQGKCTTDHISMAGPWLRFRGHLENISDNMLMGAVNAFNGETNRVWNRSTNTYGTVSGTAKMYKSEGIPSIVVAEENYGEGSSREHAAWAIAGYGFRVVVSSFFADIHKNNELNNFVLPVVVSEGFLKELFDSIHADPKMEVEVNLPEQTITNKATGKSEHFEINAYKKHCLMNGLDDIDFLLTNKDKIEAWEKASK